MSIDITIHDTGSGTCSLSGKEGEGLVVSFKDGTLREGFLTQKAFMQLVRMKFAQATKGESKPEPKPTVGAVPTANVQMPK